MAGEASSDVAVWRVRAGVGVALDRPRLMGVLNVTPDSFSDGGQLSSIERVVERARAMVSAGVDVLDVGGESTRPGASRVGDGEQIARVVPAIRALRDAGIAAPVTIDTTLASVAEAALDAGADAINDVSGGEESGWDVARLAGERGCGLVLMHRLVAPGSDVYSHAYVREPMYGGGVVGAVRDALVARADRAVSLGVAAAGVCVDPGLGFGKSVEQNLALMAAAGVFASAFGGRGHAVLWGASRKSFVGRLTGVEEASGRVAGSVGVACAVLGRGGRWFRVHDVRAHREALDAAWGVMAAEASGDLERGAPGI